MSKFGLMNDEDLKSKQTAFDFKHGWAEGKNAIIDTMSGDVAIVGNAKNAREWAQECQERQSWCYMHRKPRSYTIDWTSTEH